MAYMSQERKAQLAPAIKAALNKYGLKASIAVRHHSTLVVNIRAGRLDFIRNYNETVNNVRGHLLPSDRLAQGSLSINPYWYQDHFTGECKNFLVELFQAMNAGNHDRSEIQYDYFDVGWYTDVNIGNWNRPYILEK